MIGNLLATRSMIYTRPGDGAQINVFVDLSLPYAVPPQNPGDDQVWACDVQTRNLNDPNVHTLYGIDAIQALYLAMSFAGTLVSNSNAAANLDWTGVPNFGFPPTVQPAADGVVGGLFDGAEGMLGEGSPQLSPI